MVLLKISVFLWKKVNLPSLPYIFSLLTVTNPEISLRSSGAAKYSSFLRIIFNVY